MEHCKGRVAVVTLGCKVNQYESEAIAEAFRAAGFAVTFDEETADVYVVNTCTVTGESDRKSRQTVRRLHALNENAVLLVTGCFAEAHAKAAADMPCVDAVVGNADKLAVVKLAQSLLEKGKPQSAVCHAIGEVATAPFEPMRISQFARTRAYIKIEDGCENRCSYCAIPGARGHVRSKALTDVVAEVAALVAGGCREVVLTGIETASYGKDLADTHLIDLLEAVDGVAGDCRVRLGSLEPTLMKEDFVRRLAALHSIAPHFHLSMQSGSSRVLAAMRRKYNRDMALSGIHALRAAMPQAELTTDFIVGFPGETDADFEETMSFAREAAFLQLHVFPYSRRDGTPAAAFPNQVPSEVKKQRSAALIALGATLRRARMEQALLHPHTEVLFESYENGMAVGHTASFFEVAVKCDASLHGETRRVLLRDICGQRFLGEFEGV